MFRTRGPIVPGGPPEGPIGPWERGVEVEPLSDSMDGSRHLFKMYLDMVSSEDRAIAKRWADDAAEILLFTGLFSAVVAALLVESMKQLKQQSTDVSAFYLQNIYGVLANQSNAPTGAPIITNFPQPSFAVWVNALWFLSLANSLSCALLATMVQLWARQSIEAAQSEDSLRKQALMHAFFAAGAKKSRLPWLVKCIPFLLHISFFTFFTGLFLFLLDLHPTIVLVVYSLVGFYTVLYLYTTFHPIFQRDNPFNSPLSPLVWSLYTGILSIFFKTLSRLASWSHFHHLEDRYRKRFLDGIGKVDEGSIQKLSSQLYGPALVRTLGSLYEDHKQEKFFAGIPDFCNSTVLDNPKDIFKTPNGKVISETMVAFLHRTLISDLDVTQDVKERRIKTCMQAMEAASLPIAWLTLERVLYKDWDGLLKSVEFGLFLAKANRSNPKTEFRSKCVVAVIIATVREHDDRWFELATGQLGLQRSDLEDYLTHGDSVLLANCIHICRRMIDVYPANHWNVDANKQSRCLETVSKLNYGNTLPALQREFCKLWNHLVSQASPSTERGTRSVALRILKHIGKVHPDSHRSPNVPGPRNMFSSSYIQCNSWGSADRSESGETTHAPTSHSITDTTLPVSRFPGLRPTHSTSHPQPEKAFGDVTDKPQRSTSHWHLGSSRSTPAPLQSLRPPAGPPEMLHLSTLAVSFAPPSGDTAAPIAPGTSPSLPLTTVSSHLPSAGLDPISASSPLESQFNQTTSTTAISPLSPQVNPNIGDTYVPPVEAPRPHWTTRPDPDMATDSSLVAASSPRDVDRPQ